MLAVLVFWVFGIVFSFAFTGNAMWVRLLGAGGWTYLTVLLAKRWVLNRS